MIRAGAVLSPLPDVVPAHEQSNGELSMDTALSIDSHSRERTADDFLAAAVALAPHIRAMRDEGEAVRRMPSELAESIRRAGLFQLHLPRSMGGPELPTMAAFRVVEELSKADGSVGWCVKIATVGSVLAGWLQPEAGREMFGSPADLRVAGSFRPEGKAVKVQGGFVLSGSWTLASGIHHSNWLHCGAAVMDGDNPVLASNGAPDVRAMWVPTSQAEILDTWTTVGLRGTGSHNYRIKNVFVPEAHTSQHPTFNSKPVEQGGLYNPRLLMIVLWGCTAANALGIAKGAIQLLTEMGSSRTEMTAIPLRERAVVQATVGKAEAIVQSARAYATESIEAAWSAVVSGAADPGDKILQARLSIVHGINEALRATDMIFHSAGTNALFTKNGLERYFRDIHVVVQNVAAFPLHFEAAGKSLLGLPLTERGW